MKTKSKKKQLVFICAETINYCMTSDSVLHLQANLVARIPLKLTRVVNKI